MHYSTTVIQPRYVEFRGLRVINDDRIAPGGGIEPGDEQRKFEAGELENRLCPIAALEARVYAARLDAGREVEHRLPAGRHAWVQVARGEVTLNGIAMVEGDGAAAKPAELLLFDLA